MSTEFFRLRRPFTQARTSSHSGAHVRLSLWVNHANTGDITLRREELPEVLKALSRDDKAVLRHGIGNGKSTLLFEDDDLEPHTTLISEYGELTCLAALEAEPSNTPETP